MKFLFPWALFALTGIFLIASQNAALMLAWACVFIAWLHLYRKN